MTMRFKIQNGFIVICTTITEQSLAMKFFNLGLLQQCNVRERKGIQETQVDVRRQRVRRAYPTPWGEKNDQITIIYI